MPDEVREISINVQATRAINQLIKMGGALDRIESLAGSTDGQLRRAERTIESTAVAARNAAQTIGTLKSALSSANQETRAAERQNDRLRARLERVSAATDGVRAKVAEQTDTIKNLRQALRSLDSTNQSQLSVIRRQEREYDALKGKLQGVTAASLQAGNAGKTLAQQFAGARALQITPFGISQGGVTSLKQIESIQRANARATDAATSAQQRQNAAIRATARSAQSLEQGFHINALRYAAFDLANIFRNMNRAGIIAFKELTGASIEFERNFANVIRTTQLTDPTSIKALRDAFLDLQSTLPVTEEELTRIGTLAAQMGIAASDVAEFTSVVAKFAAASGIAADESATTLARIGQLLPEDVAGDYNRLASAILKTGVNAIATEQQIVRGTSQIASIGNVAGLSAEEIIALSSAMSSLGMSPELQRSVITSSFTKILTAVRGSTEAAEKFGAVMGMTGKEFSAAWEGDGYNTYRKLLATIAQSPKAISILQDLGLTSQRLTPNLLKLGQAYGLLGDTLADTEKGWKEASELQRQYDVIMETTASKLQVLSQAWDAFLAVFGSGGASILGDVAESLTDILKQLRSLAESPVGQFVGTLIIAVSALGVALTGVLTAVTLAGAGFLGFQYVQQQTAILVASTSGALAGQTAILDTLGVSMKVATASAKVLNLALKALWPVAVAGLVIGGANSVGKGIRDLRNQIGGTTDDIDTLVTKLTQVGDADLFAGFKNTAGIKDLKGMIEAPEWEFALNRSLPGLLDLQAFLGGDLRGSTDVLADMAKLDETLADIAKTDPQTAIVNMNKLKQSWLDAGLSEDNFNAVMVDTNEALSLQAEALGVSEGQLKDYYQGMQDTADAEEVAAVQAAALADALGLVGRAGGEAEDLLKGFQDALKSGAGSFFDFGQMLDDAYGTDAGQGGGIARFQKDLDSNLTAVQTWSDGIQQLVVRGASSLAQEFAQQGPKSQQAVLEALKLDDSTLSQLEQSMADAAFFASDAYAQAFSAESGVLAQVYKQMLSINPADALNAVHEVRDAIRNSGGVLTAEDLLGFENKYGFDLNLDLVPNIDKNSYSAAVSLLQADITPITIPVTTSVGQGDFTVTQQLDAWIVEMEGHQILLHVDPNTQEGAEIVSEWRASEYANPLTLRAYANTSEADIALDNWRLAQHNKIVSIQVRATLPDLNGSASGSGRPGIATGGLIHNGQVIRNNYPGFARGTILRGPGTGTSDSILARVSNGEAITRAAAVRYYGPKLFDDLNRMRIPKYAHGYTPSFTPTASGPSVVSNVTIVNPITKDPIRDLRQQSENVVAGVWS